jgi:hypothetical protein
LHTYFNSSVNAEEPTPSVTPTPSDTITPTPTPTPEETPTAGATPTPGGKPSISGIGGSDEEEIHESDTAKIHEHGQNNGNAGDTESETEIED